MPCLETLTPVKSGPDREIFAKRQVVRLLYHVIIYIIDFPLHYMLICNLKSRQKKVTWCHVTCWGGGSKDSWLPHSA